MGPRNCFPSLENGILMKEKGEVMSKKAVVFSADLSYMEKLETAMEVTVCPSGPVENLCLK